MYDFIVELPAIDEGRNGGFHPCGEPGSEGKGGGREEATDTGSLGTFGGNVDGNGHGRGREIQVVDPG